MTLWQNHLDKAGAAREEAQATPGWEQNQPQSKMALIMCYLLYLTLKSTSSFTTTYI